MVDKVGLCVIEDMGVGVGVGLEEDESPETHLPFNYMSRHKLFKSFGVYLYTTLNLWLMFATVYTDFSKTVQAS